MRILARFGSAASALALAAMLGGCATHLSRASAGPQPGDADFALATRAHAALATHDLAGAVDLAERAAAQTPEDATVRLLLADAYFASGRFASAESAYRDSLYLSPAQPKAVLKLALVQIAQGKQQAALSLLGTSGRMLNPADYGLAVALAGEPAEAVDVLERAARVPNAEARVRQNLALAHALAGDWQAARIVAAQDLPAGMVDSRIEQWMAFANPTRSSDQVAALVGVTPAPVDPGQPVQLALTEAPTQMAAVEPVRNAVPQPAPIVEAPADFAEFSPAPAAPLYVAEAPQSRPVVPFVEAVAPAPEVQVASAPAVAESAYVPPVAATLETKAPQSQAAPAAAAKLAEARKAAPKPRPVSLPRETGNADVVVQLGAYSSPDRVSIAWDRLTERYPVLREYAPVRARFASAKGTVWRLSIEGFASQREAIQRCEALQARGGSCFVRSSRGDAPIQLASR